MTITITTDFSLTKGFMKISVIKETSALEIRVALLPEEVQKLTDLGVDVVVEKNAAFELGYYDKDYEDAGATVIEDRAELFGDSDVVVKLKAPSMEEFPLLNKNILFSMFHASQNPQHLYELGQRKAKCIEMESLRNLHGERYIDGTDITGEVGVLYASQHLKVMPQDCQALILGYGRVGSGAINMASKLGMKYKILRKSEYKSIAHHLKGTDLLINAVSWPAEARANNKHLVTREMLENMNKHAVILDLSVDYPNPIETCRPTSLSNPWYIEDGITHISIYGYPGLVPITSTKRYSKQIFEILEVVVKNNGLENIEKTGGFGRAVQDAIIDPDQLSWKSLQPNEITKSFIE